MGFSSLTEAAHEQTACQIFFVGLLSCLGASWRFAVKTSRISERSESGASLRPITSAASPRANSFKRCPGSLSEAAEVLSVLCITRRHRVVAVGVRVSDPAVRPVDDEFGPWFSAYC